jgi:hypothetical protein
MAALACAALLPRNKYKDSLLLCDGTHPPKPVLFRGGVISGSIRAHHHMRSKTNSLQIVGQMKVFQNLGSFVVK